MSKRYICLCLCLFLLVLTLTALVSCSNSKNNGLDQFEQLLQSMKDTDSADAPTDTSEPFAQKVYVIIPKKASGELSLKASELALKIYEKTGVEAIVKYDNENTLNYNGVLEILVGDTDRLISKESLKPLSHRRLRMQVGQGKYRYRRAERCVHP